jgi:peptide/nickel transport system substrate-binding protein
MGNRIRQAESELFAADLARLGITVNASPTDDLAATLADAGSDYRFDLVVYSSAASAFPASTQPQMYATGGAKNAGGYSDAQVDAWLSDAAQSEDQSAVAVYLNKADDRISQDAYSLPLFQWPELIAFSPKLGNVRDNVTYLGPTYNLRQWDLRAPEA